MFVKICGCTREADLRAVVDAGADAVGLLSGVPIDSPRELTVGEAATLADATPGPVASVLVTMPADPAEAIERTERVGADVLQVHGSLSPADLRTVGETVDVPVVAATDPEGGLEEYAAVADALLVDAVTADGAGGTGETLDWETTRERLAGCEGPVVLAGGLTPENVGRAVDVVEPFGVDVATGVERTGGVKDHDAVRSFVARARGAGRRSDGDGGGDGGSDEDGGERTRGAFLA